MVETNPASTVADAISCANLAVNSFCMVIPSILSVFLFCSGDVMFAVCSYVNDIGIVSVTRGNRGVDINYGGLCLQTALRLAIACV